MLTYAEYSQPPHGSRESDESVPVAEYSQLVDALLKQVQARNMQAKPHALLAQALIH